ncbi:MAG TPA: DUF6526 family protein [Thermoanaerobaculia bacterium]|nr:DUF6526 family protein [Thermoanaerobaculia bacterium]
MAETVPQTYANHRRFVPLYHFVSFAILAVNQIWAVVRLVRTPSWESGFGVLLAFALLCIFYYAREFPIKVQDRLIRLEMRLRLQQVLPPDLRPRMLDLTAAQLIGLRFASDAEMTDLVRDILTNNIRDREMIKKKIKNWAADDLRA